MSIKLKKVSDQVIVITGATSGIGLSTAELAAKRGARVVISSRGESDLAKLAEKIRGAGGKCAYAVADVADEAQVRGIAETATREFGGFDTWINNAGVSIYGSVLDTPIEEDRRLFDVNYWGIVHGSRIAAEYLKEHVGAIINLGSVLSERVIPVQGQYSVSKHAVKAFTDALRMDLEKRGAQISVTLVKPSSINTPFTAHARNHMNAKATLPPPIYDPAVVARTILFCAENPKRSVIVGGAGVAFLLMENLMPRVTDKLMEGLLYRLQRERHLPKAPLSQDALFSPPDVEGEPRGDYRGHVMKSSLFTTLSLHSRAKFALGTVGLGLLLASRMRASKTANGVTP